MSNRTVSVNAVRPPHLLYSTLESSHCCIIERNLPDSVLQLSTQNQALLVCHVSNSLQIFLGTKEWNVEIQVQQLPLQELPSDVFCNLWRSGTPNQISVILSLDRVPVLLVSVFHAAFLRARHHARFFSIHRFQGTGLEAGGCGNGQVKRWSHMTPTACSFRLQILIRLTKNCCLVRTSSSSSIAQSYILPPHHLGRLLLLFFFFMSGELV